MKVLILICVTIGLIVALVQWRAGLNEARAEATYPPQGQLIDVDGTQVHALVMGNGPDLVLLHGASGNTRDMSFGFAEALSSRYRVIIFDRPALGWTGHVAPKYGRLWPRRAESPMQQAALLQAAARTLSVTRPVIVGQSFGGAVAWAWGLRAPDEVAAIVSIAGVANPWPGQLSLLHRVNASVLGGAIVVPLLTAFTPRKVLEDTVESIFAPQSAPEGYMAHVGVGLTLRRKTLRGNARQITALRPHIVDISAQYDSLTMPVEIVHGDADTIVPLDIHSASLPAQMPQAHLTVLKGAGHMPHHTHQTDVIAAIDRAAARAGLRWRR